MLADAGAAGGDEEVDARKLVGGGGDGGHVVGRNREDDGFGAGFGDEGRERVGVGGDDAAGNEWFAGKRDLVAGGEDGNTGAAVDREPGVVGGGGKADCAGSQALAGVEEGVAALEVATARADVAAENGAFAKRKRVADAVGVFLDRDGIGAGGDQAAGEEAEGLAGADRAVERVAGWGAPNDGPGARVGGAHGVAVHGGEVGGRLVEAGGDRRREDPPDTGR